MPLPSTSRSAPPPSRFRAWPKSDWLGTSMGGLLGIRLASLAGAPIRRLILNDIGPYVPLEGRLQAADAYADDPSFGRIEEAVAWHQEHRAEMGPMREADWLTVTEWPLIEHDGGFRLHTDPGIWANRDPTKLAATDYWAEWERIRAPTLTIWGTESRLLLAGDVARMLESGPRSEILEVPGVGHAPPLLGEAIVEGVREFLLR